MSAEMNVSDRDSGAELDMTSGSGYWDLNCRTVRIGSYKFIPHGPVLVSEHGVRMDVPAINRRKLNLFMAYSLPVDLIIVESYLKFFITSQLQKRLLLRFRLVRLQRF